MTKTQRDQNEELVRITIQMDKDIALLEKMLSKQGSKAGASFMEAINCLYDAKKELEEHAKDIRKQKTGTCRHHDAYVD